MVTKGYGFSIEDINWSCPADLRPYAKAHEQSVAEQDMLNYVAIGRYYRSTIGDFLTTFGKKGATKPQFPEEPFIQKMFVEANVPRTKEEIEEATREFFRQRMKLKEQFERGRR